MVAKDVITSLVFFRFIRIDEDIDGLLDEKVSEFLWEFLLKQTVMQEGRSYLDRLWNQFRFNLPSSRTLGLHVAP